MTPASEHRARHIFKAPLWAHLAGALPMCRGRAEPGSPGDCTLLEERTVSCSQIFSNSQFTAWHTLRHLVTICSRNPFTERFLRQVQCCFLQLWTDKLTLTAVNTSICNLSDLIEEQLISCLSGDQRVGEWAARLADVLPSSRAVF